MASKRQRLSPAYNRGFWGTVLHRELWLGVGIPFVALLALYPRRLLCFYPLPMPKPLPRPLRPLI